MVRMFEEPWVSFWVLFVCFYYLNLSVIFCLTGRKLEHALFRNSIFTYKSTASSKDKVPDPELHSSNAT